MTEQDKSAALGFLVGVVLTYIMVVAGR